MEVEVLDVGTACRLCLSVSANHTTIFEDPIENDPDHVALPKRISACVGFEIHQNEDLPSLICNNCLREVDRWFVFRTQCRSTNDLLNKILSEGYQFISASPQEKGDEELPTINAALKNIVKNSSSKTENADQEDAPSSATEQESSCPSIESRSESILVTAVQSIGLSSENTEEKKAENSDEGSDYVDDTYDSCDEVPVQETNDTDSVHWRLKPVSCPLCSKTFSKHQGVKLHLRIVHTVLKVFPCLICAHVSCSSIDRKKHISKRHPAETLKKNTCTFCGIHIKANCSFTRHLKKHDNERNCELCGLELDSIEALQKHLRTEHQEEPPDGVERCYHCHICKNVSFWKEKDWRAHYLDVHHTEEVFPCMLCDRAYRTKLFLAIHMRSHTGEKPYMCEQCATRFTSKHSLRNHMRKHTRKFECKVCLKTYTSYASLVYHKRSHTGETPYVCHECGKTFKSLNGVQFHSRIHTGEKPFSCEHCGFTCRNYSGLYAHKVKHSEERPFYCDECGKSFKMKAWLKEHKKTHTGVKDYVCKICSHAFIANYQLKSHMKTHSGVRPHMCEFCPKAFARRDTLTEHLRTHTKETKYSCKICLRGFMFLKPFKKHKCTSEIFESEPDAGLTSDAFEDNE